MGAVMGSKLLKAIVVKGTRPIPQADPAAMKALGFGDLKKVGQIDKESGWSIQSTTGVLAWCNEVAGLPVRNFRKTHHPEAWKIDGERLNNARVATYGCPNCTMRCGITIHDREGRESELDYENIGLLGSNLEIFELDQVGSLNYLCDEYGLDTMSAGCVLSFYADAIERRATAGDFGFGDAEAAKKLLTMAAFRDGKLGNLLADGSRRMARAFGHGSEAYAMQVKGLEVAAYNCKFIPGQALAFGVAAIGAHHREAWIITFELKNTTRESLPLDRARLGPGQLSEVFQHRDRAELGPGRHVGRGRPGLRPHQTELPPGIPARRPTGRLSPGRLVRPGERRPGWPDRRESPRPREIRRPAPALLRPARLRPAGHPDPGHPRPARPGEGSRRGGEIRPPGLSR
jgi:aldehyde:ferredoxin oxidoreductase